VQETETAAILFSFFCEGPEDSRALLPYEPLVQTQCPSAANSSFWLTLREGF